ncbi:unnamed protein product, partial [Amoebophrya sp. A120]
VVVSTASATAGDDDTAKMPVLPFDGTGAITADAVLPDSSSSKPPAPPFKEILIATLHDYFVQFHALYLKSFHSPSVLCSIWLIPILFLFLLEGVRLLQKQPLTIQTFDDAVNAGKNRLSGNTFPDCMYFDQYYADFQRHQEMYP